MANLFGQTLVKARVHLGYSSAKKFFEEVIEIHNLDLNYSYYRKIEKGDVFPSSKLTSQISMLFEQKIAEHLISTYCQSQFENYRHLFPSEDVFISDDEPSFAELGFSSDEIENQSVNPKELTPKQIAAISENQTNYYIFLLSTLARSPLSIEEISKRLGVESIESSINKLEENKLIRKVGDNIEASAIEASLPKNDSPFIKDAYKKMDDWDISFSETFQLKLKTNKMMIRRVSKRYLSLLDDQLHFLFNFIQSADELDYRHNDEVVQVQVNIHHGRLPG